MGNEAATRPRSLLPFGLDPQVSPLGRVFQVELFAAPVSGGSLERDDWQAVLPGLLKLVHNDLPGLDDRRVFAEVGQNARKADRFLADFKGPLPIALQVGNSIAPLLGDLALDVDLIGFPTLAANSLDLQEKEPAGLVSALELDNEVRDVLVLIPFVLKTDAQSKVV